MGIDLPHCSFTHFNSTNVSEAPTQCWVVPAAEQELKLWDVVLQQPLDTGQGEPRELRKALMAGRRRRLSSRKEGIGRFRRPEGRRPSRDPRPTTCATVRKVWDPALEQEKQELLLKM